jgi:hypothetical protein
LSDLPVVSPDPVTAQVMKTLRFISSGMAILLVISGSLAMPCRLNPTKKDHFD